MPRQRAPTNCAIKKINKINPINRTNVFDLRLWIHVQRVWHVFRQTNGYCRVTDARVYRTHAGAVHGPGGHCRKRFRSPRTAKRAARLSDNSALMFVMSFRVLFRRACAVHGVVGPVSSLHPHRDV